MGGKDMSFYDDAPMLQPCYGRHDVVIRHYDAGHTVLPTRTDGNYFAPPASPFYVGSGKMIFEFCGQHVFREGPNLVCLKDVFTGEKRDLLIDDFNTLLGPNNSWRVLNEMEVLAWAATR